MHSRCRSLSVRLVLCFSSIVVSTLSAVAAGHPFLASDYVANRIVWVDADGTLVWTCPAPRAQDVWLLPNGNVLFCHQLGVKEVTPDLGYLKRREKDPNAVDGTKVVWQFDTQSPNEVHSCQPLPDGRCLVGVSGEKPAIHELDAQGRVVLTVPIQTNQTKIHSQMRSVRKTARGTYLVGQNMEGVVREYDATGKVLREIPIEGSNPYLALPLPGGNLLIACGDGHKAVEIDPAGKTVWQLDRDDVPGNPLCFVAGIQQLPNGNRVISNYSGGNHGTPGAQPQVFEITRDKQLVWEFDDFPTHQHFTQVQLLDISGDVTQGEILK